ncbi:hypothetical protein CN582_24630 [Bacillus wiedmannii]|nr:hypothetical protein CN582_24630 [Bacillus wiedmannii]PHA57857.1 hypothetical protein COF07_12120 [Bacillus wiedmannii]
MIGSKEKGEACSHKGTFFFCSMNLYIFLYIPIMARFYCSCLLPNYPKNCMKSCMLLAWFFSKMLAVPLVRLHSRF